MGKSAETRILLLLCCLPSSLQIDLILGQGKDCPSKGGMIDWVQVRPFVMLEFQAIYSLFIFYLYVQWTGLKWRVNIYLSFLDFRIALRLSSAISSSIFWLCKVNCTPFPLIAVIACSACFPFLLFFLLNTL